MDTFVRMSRALLSVPFLYALSALTLCSVLCVVVSCLSFSFSTRPQLTRWWVDALFFLLSACHYSACSLRFRLVFVFFYLPLFHHHFHSWHDNYCPLPTLLCYSACAYINNVWMFVMCMYPSTLTCLMLCLLLCSCCCNPNPDLLLCHVVVFHKLVYIYITRIYMWM